MKLIGLYSSTPQSGKSAVAKYLEKKYKFEVLPFAAVLKGMAASLLGDMGYSGAAIQQMLYGSAKQTVVYQDKTVRHLLQTLGTEWGRRCMGEHFWVDIWRLMAEEHLAEGVRVVVDDMRFINEMTTVQALGGWTWKIMRPGARAPTNGHASEGALDHLLFDTELINCGTLEDLEVTIEEAIRAGGR